MDVNANSPETKERLRVALNQVAAELSDGKPLAEAAGECAQFVRVILDALEHVSSPAKIAAILDALPMLTARQLKTFEFVCRFAPKILKGKTMSRLRAHMGATETIIRGRRPALSYQDSKDICREVVRLNIFNDVPLTEAKKRMSQRYGISLRTVDQVWSERSRFLTKNPVSEEDARRIIDDLFSEFQTDTAQDR